MSVVKWILVAAISVLILAIPVAKASPLNSTEGASKFTEIISSIIDTVQQTTMQFADMVLRASLTVVGALYAPLAAVGIILYVTHINRYLGKQLIVGALLLAFFVEFVLPAFNP